MIRKTSNGWVLLASLACLCSCGAAQGVQIDYSPKLDAVCAVFFRPAIENSWKTELVSILPQFERQWKDLGARLIRGSEEVLGRQIDQNLTVHVTLCNTPSRSVPLILNMRYALSAFTDSPVSLRVKVGTLHHEILHRAIENLIPDDSRVLAEYPNEHDRVRNHLHLLAVQKATYLELGLDAELAELIDVDSQLPNGFYKRAWEIVNAEPQRYQQPVAELRDGAE